MNALTSRSALLGSLSPAALGAQLTAADLKHIELDTGCVSRAALREMNRLSHQREALADAMVTTPPETPADALASLMAALGWFTNAVDNEDPADRGRVAAQAEEARRSVVRSLVVLADFHDVSLRDIGGSYILSAPGEPCAPVETDHDRDLFAACAAEARAWASSEAYLASFGGADVPEGDPRASELLRAHIATIGPVCSITAKTGAGHKARAAVLARIGGKWLTNPDDPDDAPIDRVKAALVRDLVGGVAA